MMKRIALTGLVTILALAAGIISARAASLNIPPLSESSTEEIVEALNQRGVPVAGHGAPNLDWASVRSFKLSVVYTVGSKRLVDTTLNCQLDQGPCVITIPAPDRSGTRSRDIAFAFVNREDMRRQLVAEGLAPIGVDALRGDAIGVELLDKDHRSAPVHKFKDAFLGRWNSFGGVNYMKPPNRETRIVQAAPVPGNRAYRWAVSYTQFKENGLIIDNPQTAGGSMKLTVIEGDPAPGTFDFKLSLHSTSQLIDEMGERGISATIRDAVRVPSPARFYALLEAEIISNTDDARSDPRDKQRIIVCDLTRGPCDVFFRDPWQRRLGYQFIHPLSLAMATNTLEKANAITPMIVALDRAELYRASSWSEFEESTGLSPIAAGLSNNDPAKPQTFVFDDFMRQGIKNVGKADWANWNIKLRIVRLLH